MAVVSGQARVASVAAILTVGGRYALQLRDNPPTRIAFPGHWGLFGGERARGEGPREAVRREIAEELVLDVSEWRELWTVPYRSAFDGHLARCAVFAAEVTALWPRHRLREGRAVGLFALESLPQPIIPLAVELLERYDQERPVARGDDRA